MDGPGESDGGAGGAGGAAGADTVTVTGASAVSPELLVQAESARMPAAAAAANFREEFMPVPSTELLLP